MIFTDLCGSIRRGLAPCFRSMKRFVAFFLLVATPLLAEEVTLKQPALLKADRNAVSLKTGTVVELISRDGSEVTIKYRNLTGKIPANKLDEPKPTASAAKPAPPAAKASEEKKEKGESKTAENKPANPPQTIYGKAVQKAKDNAAAHDKNLVKPTDEVLKDR